MIPMEETIEEIKKILNEGRIPPSDDVLLDLSYLQPWELFVLKKKLEGETYAEIGQKLEKRTSSRDHSRFYGDAVGMLEIKAWDIGDKGISPEQTRAIFNKALRKLRHPARSFVFASEILNEWIGHV